MVTASRMQNIKLLVRQRPALAEYLVRAKQDFANNVVRVTKWRVEIKNNWCRVVKWNMSLESSHLAKFFAFVSVDICLDMSRSCTELYTCTNMLVYNCRKSYDMFV